MRLCRRKLLVYGLLSAAILLAAGEYYARFHLGLGTPPLFFTHPTIEYMLKPDQDVYHNGKRILVNQYGMRAAPFVKEKSPGELRIMVFGDSVLGGRNRIDHSSLSTTIVQERLKDSRGEVTVGHISAGSWGPGNWLAYAKEYGFFGADVVILVISSNDYADNPTFKPLNRRTHPTTNPALALTEWFSRDLLRNLPGSIFDSTPPQQERTRAPTEKEILRGLGDLKEFLALAKSATPHVVVLQHWERTELVRSETWPGNTRIREVCEAAEVAQVSLEPYLRQAIDSGNDPYRDRIHLNQAGHQQLAEVILANLPAEYRPAMPGDDAPPTEESAASQHETDLGSVPN